MKIVFVTTQSPVQSTLIGRVIPLAEEFQTMGNSVTVLVHKEDLPDSPLYPRVPIKRKIIGKNPFERTSKGKQRYSGLYLIWTMKINALRAAWQLVKIRPDIVVISKPLPENTLAVLIAKPFVRNAKIILDVDDFELEANKLTSLLQRAAIHWSERVAVRLASHIIVATPFLGDHMQLIAGNKRPVTLIPTGLSISSTLGALPTGGTKHTLLFAGSLSISSGHRVDMLPEILSLVRASIPDAKLIIAGSGDDEHTLKEQFEKLGLGNAVDWRGRFSMETMRSLVAESGILIDPIDASIANRAKSSFRAALALAYGVPIITSSIGIRTSMIPPTLHEKFFAKPATPNSYAEKIIIMLQGGISNEEARHLHHAALGYTYDHLARLYYNCFV